MKLSGRAFNRHLNHLGQGFQWRRGFACPCTNASSGQPDPNCASCSGKGRIWDAQAVSGTAGVVSQTRLRRYETFGPFDQDDMMLSIGSDSPLYPMGQYDRVDALDRSEPFSIAYVRGLNDVIRFPVVSIERAFYLTDAGVPVELAAPTVQADGSLVWTGGAPPAKKSYSLTGRRRPQYYCYLELPTDRPMHHGEPLPRKVILRRYELFGRSR